MVKNDFIKGIGTKTVENNYTMKEIAEIVQALETYVHDTLAANPEEVIPLGKMGKFSVKHVPAKNGVSAINGKEWHTEAHDEIVFKIGKTYKML